MVIQALLSSILAPGVKKRSFEQIDDSQQGKVEGFDSCDRPSNLTQIGFKSSVFRPYDLEIWWMTSKNNRAPLLYATLTVFVPSIGEFGLALLSENAQFGSKSAIFFFVPCDLENWQMTLKTIRHLFHAISGFVHHFIVISEWQLHLPVRKRPIRVEIVDFFVPCDLKISWMTLKNDRTTLLCYIKLCASYRSNRSI